MHHHTGTTTLAGNCSANSFHSQSWVIVPTLLQGVPKTLKYGPQVSKKLHFQICHYAMLPSGDALENFYMGA